VKKYFFNIFFIIFYNFFNNFIKKVTERVESYFNLSVDVEQNTSLSYCLKKYISKGKKKENLFNIIHKTLKKILYHQII
jgi:hypothetical protein